MRFITEFKVNELEYDLPGHPVASRRREVCNNKLGNLIGDSFKWETPVNGNKLRHRLEIEAFPMDKWVEFKQKLFMECGMPEPNAVAILEMVKDLEFYSNNKQSVDAITNLTDQMEYRGPNSHCKACEDEKAGIKHIQSQRHTCKK